MKVRNNYIPDVLDCLANLSSDEVFTPPIVANRMLDMLPQEIFKSKETTFLDPFSKSGVFLREITKRLLENQIPNYKKMASEIEFIEKGAIQEAVKNGTLDLNDKDYEKKAKEIGYKALDGHKDADIYHLFEDELQETLNHILTKQVYGIAITELTAQLTRRSLYCSKDAACRYSICTDFGVNGDGNIRFVPMKHTWDRKQLQNGTFPKGTSCKYCGASAEQFERPDELETHAYEFIHKEIEEIREELGNMEFTVICGNPPFQLSTANDTGINAAQAKPIYHKFVEQAIKLNSKYLVMITPSRWFSGGWGLDDFRDFMINSHNIVEMHDFQNSKECFPNVEIKGGVSYFLWEKDANRDCKFVQHNEGIISEITRPLKEDNCNVLIRHNDVISIYHKIVNLNKNDDNMDSIINVCSKFNLENLEKDFPKYSGRERRMSSNILSMDCFSSDKIPNSIAIYGILDGKRTYKYIKSDYVDTSASNIDKYKVLLPKAEGNGQFGETVTNPFIIPPQSGYTHTFYGIGEFDTKPKAENALKYIKTKFARALFSVLKITQNVNSDTWAMVPLQDFDEKSDINWNKTIAEIDEQLYKKYNLSQQEIDFIESNVKPMA